MKFNYLLLNAKKYSDYYCNCNIFVEDHFAEVYHLPVGPSLVFGSLDAVRSFHFATSLLTSKESNNRTKSVKQKISSIIIIYYITLYCKPLAIECKKSSDDILFS